MALSIDLRQKKGLVLGIANAQSIAYGCASAFVAAGAELAVTYLNEKAKPYVAPLADQLGCALFLPCNVEEDLEIETLFSKIEKTWGKLDFLLHSIAYAPKDDLHGRVIDSSKQGFLEAIDVSCHSFARLAKHAEPLMAQGGSLLTVSYIGSAHVIPNYGLMGPVKAALESLTRYLAFELGPLGIRVNALSPGPIKTRAASGLLAFDSLVETAQDHSFLHTKISIEDVGAMAAFLVSDLSRTITGGVHLIDAGFEGGL